MFPSHLQEIFSENKRSFISIAIYLFTTCVIVYIITSFVLPQYDQLDQETQKLNTMIADNAKLKKNGFTASQFKAAATTHGKKVDSLLTDPKQLDAILKKPESNSKDYLTWIMSKNQDVKDRSQEIQNNQAVISNILPMFASANPINSISTSTPIRRQITLDTFVAFVENVILRGFNLQSPSTIGFRTINFDASSSGAINVGTFKIPLDFKGRNRDIRRMLTYIQDSGNFRIVGKSIIGAPSPDAPKLSDPTIPDNLLISIVSVELEKDLSDDSTVNNGKITLQFYVEGIGVQEVIDLRKSITDTYDALVKSINSGANACGDGTTCSNDRMRMAASALQALQMNVSAMKPKIDDIKKRSKIDDVQSEYDELIGITKSLSTISAQVNKYLDTLNISGKDSGTGTGASASN